MKHIFRSWNSICSFLKVTPSQILQGEDLGPLQEIWMVKRSPLSCWESGKPPGTFRLCCQDCHGICQRDWISLSKEAQDHWHWWRIVHEVLWQRKKHYHSHFNVEILPFIVHNSYTDASEPKGFEFQTYRQQLQEAAPDLFSGRYRVRSAHFFHFLDLQKLGWKLTHQWLKQNRFSSRPLKWHFSQVFVLFTDFKFYLLPFAWLGV